MVAAIAFGADEVRRALEEDRAFEDVTTALLGAAAGRTARGRFVAEEPVVVAGGPVAAEAFRLLDGGSRFEQRVPEGGEAGAGTAIAVVEARVRSLLGGERVALNFLQRLSGIATMTRRAVEAIRGTGALVTDTRKTTPGLRALEKYAVRAGGGVNHRHSLADGILWKDNHWAVFGGTDLRAVLRAAPAGVPVIVEVENDAQLEAALAAGVTRILVDNQPPEVVARWAKRCGPTVAIEASGGISPERAAVYARAGARYISIGALTHSAPAARIRFEIDPLPEGAVEG